MEHAAYKFHMEPVNKREKTAKGVHEVCTSNKKAGNLTRRDERKAEKRDDQKRLCTKAGHHFSISNIINSFMSVTCADQ